MPNGVFQDLNDLRLFAMVVEHGGFSAASRATGVPKSRLSKRVSVLEARLGVRLLQRTTRQFVVTETGQRFYYHCRAMLADAQEAQDAVDMANGEPRGIVRVSCPVSLADTMLAPLLPQFLARYPKVVLRLLCSDRRVDLIAENYDIALRVRSKLDTDATLIVREFGQSDLVLVASAELWRHHARPRHVAALSGLPTLSMEEREAHPQWSLVGSDGRQVDIPIAPRLVTGSFSVLLSAAEAGLGVALMPLSICTPALEAGRLARVLPEWRGLEGTMHFVYPSRRGLLPAVRVLVDFLAEHLPARAALSGNAIRVVPLAEPVELASEPPD